MSAAVYSIQEEIEHPENKRFHVVILGAGASLAAFPNGDRHGRQLPLIKNFVDVVGLAEPLQANNINPPYNDFEAIYSDIAVDPNQEVLRKELEQRVHDYLA